MFTFSGPATKTDSHATSVCSLLKKFLALLHLNILWKQTFTTTSDLCTCSHHFFWLLSSQDPLWLSRVLVLFHSCKCLLRLHSVMWGQRPCHWRSPLMSGMSSAFLIPPLTWGQRHADCFCPGIAALVSYVCVGGGAFFKCWSVYFFQKCRPYWLSGLHNGWELICLYPSSGFLVYAWNCA